MADTELILTDEGINLVLVAKEKYILNWNKESIVNNKPKVNTIRRFRKTQVT
jgi:hypothetical protein